MTTNSSPEPRDHVVRSDAAHQPGSRCAENRVPREMAPAVVDVLETIDVTEQECPPPLLRGPVTDSALETPR